MIDAIGTASNHLLQQTTDGLEANAKGCLVTDSTGATTRDGVFAGGDAVTGSATVILAMGAGKNAAKNIDQYIKSRQAPMKNT